MTISLDEASIGKDLRVYAIGDVHGCVDELKSLLFLIERDLIDNPIQRHRLIFIGDYVDRGPYSRDVINLLIALKNDATLECTFLRGNHEEKLIRVCTKLDADFISGFAKYGGTETLESYGISKHQMNLVLKSNVDKTDYINFCKTVRSHVGEEHLDFLNTLELSDTEGDYFFCHAGVDPALCLENQNEHDLVWMREPFLSWEEPLEKVIVHGHTPVDRPETLQHRINIDTGCVFGEKLTCVVLEGKQRRFIDVQSGFAFQKR